MYLLLFHDTELPLHIFQLPTVDLPSCTADEPEDTQKTPVRCEYIIYVEIQSPSAQIYIKYN